MSFGVEFLLSLVKELGKAALDGLLHPRLTRPLMFCCLVALLPSLAAGFFAWDLNRQRFVAVAPGHAVYPLWQERRGELELVVIEPGGEETLALFGKPRFVYVGRPSYLHRWLWDGHKEAAKQKKRREKVARHLLGADVSDEEVKDLGESLDPLEGEPPILPTRRLLPGAIIRVSLRCRGSRRPLLELHEEEVWTVTEARKEEDRVKLLTLNAGDEITGCRQTPR
jgi:hypothetical protein